MENNIVEILIKQHRVLQADLTLVASFAQLEKPNIAGVVLSLNDFKKNLVEHLGLENNEFYPELLKKMEERNMNVINTKKFIEEMKTIGVAVMAFLEKYNLEKEVENNINAFKEDLLGIINALNMRVESEEMGVFTYWTIFQNV